MWATNDEVSVSARTNHYRIIPHAAYLLETRSNRKTHGRPLLSPSIWVNMHIPFFFFFLDQKAAHWPIPFSIENEMNQRHNVWSSRHYQVPRLKPSKLPQVSGFTNKTCLQHTGHSNDLKFMCLTSDQPLGDQRWRSRTDHNGRLVTLDQFFFVFFVFETLDQSHTEGTEDALAICVCACWGWPATLCCAV
jgi:hypothetical protein